MSPSPKCHTYLSAFFLFAVHTTFPPSSHMHAHTHACMHAHASSPFGIALLSEKLPFKRAQPPVAPCWMHWVPCHQSQEQGRDTLTSSLSLPLASILGKQEVWGLKWCSQVEQETAILGHTDPCAQGRSQHDWSEPPAHLCSAPGGVRWPNPPMGLPNQRHSAKVKHDSRQQWPRTALFFPSLMEGQLALAKHSGTKEVSKNIQIIKTETTPLNKNVKYFVQNNKRLGQT